MNRKKEASDAYTKALVTAQRIYYAEIRLARETHREAGERAYDRYIRTMREIRRKENERD